MAKTEVVRVASDLYDLAQTEAQTMGRSTAAQISHWARLGRALEHSRIPSSAIHQVLAGQADFDALDPIDQQAVAGEWAHQMSDVIAELDLASEFAASGEAYAELDDDGNVVEVPAQSHGERAPASPRAASGKAVTKPSIKVPYEGQTAAEAAKSQSGVLSSSSRGRAKLVDDRAEEARVEADAP